MAHDVFISYSRKDIEIADRIEKELNSYGIECFIDRSNIELGQDFAEIIAEAIYECPIILFVWSENSNQSENTANEIALAIEFEKTVVSFKIGAFKPSPKLAYRLIRFNRIDAIAFNEDKIVELGAKIALLLGKKPTGSKSVSARANDPADNAVNAEPARTAAAKESDKYEYSYQTGRQALLRYDIPTAFSNLLEPALNDYKDSRFLMAQIVWYRTRIWKVADSEFDYLKEMADKGNSYAQFIMGRFYSLKQDDDEKSVEYACKSAEQNDSYGLFSLARCYDLGVGVNKNNAKYISLLKRAIAENNPFALLEFAKNHIHGWTGKRNLSYGIELLKKAIELNMPEAFVQMGYVYYYGNGVQRDEKIAEEYLHKAIESGYIEAYHDLGILYLYEPDTKNVRTDKERIAKGIKYYLKGAEYNEPNCLSGLASCYYNGVAVDKDLRNAMKWFRKSAAAGDRFAYFMIGYMYYYGEGVKEDNNLAWDWFDRGAKLIDSNCLWMKGIMCMDGNAPGHEKKDCIAFFEESIFLGGYSGEISALKLYDIFRTDKLEKYDVLKSDPPAYSWAEQDDEKALNYLKRGAEMGNEEALFKYGVYLTDLELPLSDEILGRKYLEESLSKSYYRAALRLAYLYKNGIGVMKDNGKAQSYCDTARENGDDEVVKLAESLTEKTSESTTGKKVYTSADEEFDALLDDFIAQQERENN